MDIEKSIETIDYQIFGRTILKIIKKMDVNYKQDVEPIQPILEIDLKDD